jgi:hypothetical protein
MKNFLDIEPLTTDTRSLEVANAYWAMDELGEWTISIAALSTRYGVSAPTIKKIANSAWSVRIPSIVCMECNGSRHVDSRTDLRAIFGQGLTTEAPTRQMYVCHQCRCKRTEREHAARVAKQKEKERCVIAWLELNENTSADRFYEQATPFEAFLLSGLLRYAGEDWSGNKLNAWSSYQPRLCATESDIRDVYKTLYEAGWIVPNSDTSPSAVICDDDLRVTGLDVLNVSWTLSNNSGDLASEDLLTTANNTLGDASLTDLKEIWYRVCLFELRGHFEYVIPRLRFTNPWTDAVSKVLRQVLLDHSLAQTKSIIWASLNHLNSLKQDRNYKSYVVNNMVPGCFLKTCEKYRAEGWAFKTLPRLSHTKEALYTGYLFDRVLGGGSVHFESLTGSNFEAQIADRH